MNWDDLRYVLAVADHGSVSAAARKLNVTHATVLRRVASFENGHGERIFEKDPTGYRVREGCERIIEAAREVAGAVDTVDRLIHGARAPLRGVVRISSTDSFCCHVLPAMIRRLRHSAPDLHLELVSSNHHVDVGRLQADVTVRPATALTEDLTGEICAELSFFAYAAEGVSAGWLGLHGPLARSVPGQWMAENVPREQVAAGSDSFLALCEIARLGIGIAILPVFVGDAASELRRRPDLMPELRVPVWTATHIDLSESPRIRLARRHVTEYLQSRAPMLAGQG